MLVDLREQDFDGFDKVGLLAKIMNRFQQYVIVLEGNIDEVGADDQVKIYDGRKHQA